MNIFLEIFISILLGFLFILLIFLGYKAYSHIMDDIEKRERKKLRKKEEEERYGK
jgi:predicted membrane protein